MKRFSLVIFVLGFFTLTACNLGDDPPIQELEPCELCTGSQICVDGACCSPASCEDAGASCGSIVEDSCSTTLDCGSCSGGLECQENQCVDTCEPDTCETLGAVCGSHMDGCGGMLDCGACACTLETFQDDCPDRACRVATGCSEAFECEYAAVECGGHSCDCPGGNCGVNPVRCDDGSSCPASYCDPRPTEVGGEIVFENACVSQIGADVPTCVFEGCYPGTCDAGDACVRDACGTCGLGEWSCPGNVASCEELVVPVEDAVCDDRSIDSTFVYMRTGISPSAPEGTRAAPYGSLQEAIDSAANRGASGVIVGGSADIEEAISLVNGVSVYAGYNSEFRADSGQMPRIRVQGDAELLQGVLADGINEDTVLRNFRIVVENQGSDAYGVIARNSPALILVNLHIEVSAGDGESPFEVTLGEPVQPGMVGGSHNNLTGADAGVNPDCPGANGGEGGRGEGTTGTGRSHGQESPAGACGGGYLGNDGQSGCQSIPAGNLDNGNGGLADSDILDGRWNSTHRDGTNGGRGRNGGGGGGGGGAARFQTGGSTIAGAGGGGGGAGGCGGAGGLAGTGGGHAIGILFYQSSGVIMESIEVDASAGDGGVGATGQPGQPGAPGGLGRNLSFTITNPNRSGDGGNGTSGIAGGFGGSGSGGDAIGVVCHETPLESPDLTAATRAGQNGGGTVPGEAGREFAHVGCVADPD